MIVTCPLPLKLFAVNLLCLLPSGCDKCFSVPSDSKQGWALCCVSGALRFGGRPHPHPHSPLPPQGSCPKALQPSGGGGPSAPLVWGAGRAPRQLSAEKAVPRGPASRQLRARCAADTATVGRGQGRPLHSPRPRLPGRAGEHRAIVVGHALGRAPHGPAAGAGGDENPFVQAPRPLHTGLLFPAV